MRLRFLLHPLSVLVVFALAVTSCATSDATNADSAGPPSAPEVEEVAGSSTAVEDDPGDTTTLAELLAVSDGSESQTMFWRSLHIEGALFDAVPSIGELSKRSSIVVVGEVLSYVDGRTYESLEENTVDVAPPLLSFRLVEVEVRVDQIVAGELAPGTEAARLKLDIWRPADAPKVESEVPATGSKVILFLVSQRASDINREELVKAIGEESAEKFLDDIDDRYALPTPQGILVWDGKEFVTPLVIHEPDADGEEEPDNDPFEVELASTDPTLLEAKVESEPPTIIVGP